MIKLGTQVKDKVTGLTGCLTLMQIYSDNSVQYAFQPKGLTVETKQPLTAFWITQDRIENGIEIPDKELPVQVLNTQVEDIASGYKGIATSLQLHINGCVHFWVKSKDITKTGETAEECNFDIRRLKGKLVPKFTEEELNNDKKTRPSPSYVVKCGPKMIKF